MRQDRGEIDDPGALVDRGRLYRGALMLAQDLADDIEPTRQRRVAKGLFRPPWSIPAEGSPFKIQRRNFRSAVTMRCGSAWVLISTHLPCR